MSQLSDIPADLVHVAQQAAVVRLHLWLLAEVHEALAKVGDAAQARAGRGRDRRRLRAGFLVAAGQQQRTARRGAAGGSAAGRPAQRGRPLPDATPQGYEARDRSGSAERTICAPVDRAVQK